MAERKSSATTIFPVIEDVGAESAVLALPSGSMDTHVEYFNQLIRNGGYGEELPYRHEILDAMRRFIKRTEA
jgi:hypothetical protein